MKYGLKCHYKECSHKCYDAKDIVKLKAIRKTTVIHVFKYETAEFLLNSKFTIGDIIINVNKKDIFAIIQK